MPVQLNCVFQNFFGHTYSWADRQTNRPANLLIEFPFQELNKKDLLLGLRHVFKADLLQI